MTKLKSVLACVFLVTIPFAAEADQTSTYTFDSVTKVQYTVGSATITGILVGDTSPTAVSVPETSSMSNCEPLYKEMLSTPGRYFLDVTVRVISGPTADVRQIQSCSLESKP